MQLSVNIQPVYSQYHPTAQMGNTRLLQHQVETREAFNDPDVDVIFNVAMTGDGKSLGAYLSAFQDRKAVIAMYPTNELIQDQYRSLPKYEESLGITLARTSLMYSEEITRFMLENDDMTRFAAVQARLHQNDILLTNPDLIHLIMSLQYGWKESRKELPQVVQANFDYYLFDEFHIFGIPQVISVMNMLGYLYTLYKDKSPANRKKFVFLSATPHPLLEKYLKQGGFRYRIIQGHYSTQASPEHRCILQPCGLELHEVSQEQPTESWIEGHIENLRDLFLQQPVGQPRPKAAILVYSVATARRLVALLKERLEKPYGITIGENTGLTNRDDREDSRKKDILVGTSTVDVGVDFRINYLVFEAFNAGTFLQRFGRLGRHAGFASYQAHALVPRFIIERLSEKIGAATNLDRLTFNQYVQEVFPAEAEFSYYPAKWGIFQTAHILKERQCLKDEDAAFMEALIAQYDRQFASDRYPGMAQALKRYYARQKKAPETIKELISFRGQSQLSCGVWDTDDYLKTYDLFFLLTNTEFVILEKAEFMREVEGRKEELEKRGLDVRSFEKQLLYLKILRYIPERRNLVLGLNYSLSELSQHLHTLQVVNSVFVREPRHVWLDKVNKALKRLNLPCVVSDMERAELKNRLRLGAVFPLYRLQDSLGTEYSIAFGLDAFLLESLLFFRETHRDNALFL